MLFCSIRLTSLCSQACLQCSIPEQSDGSFISPEDFAIVTAKLKQYGTQVLTLTGGEPALHPDLEEIFKIAVSRGFRTVGLLSNLYYSEEHQDKVIDLASRYKVGIHCSYDGLGDIADLLRGAKDVQNIVERGMQKINALRLKGLYDHKPTATIVVSAINIHQIKAIIDRLQDMDWNLNIDLYRWGSANHNEQDMLKIQDPNQIDDLLKLIRGAKNLKTPLWYYDGIQNHIKGMQKKQCPYIISPTFGSKFFVHENGELHTCLDFGIGNLINQEISEIFQSDKWRVAKRDFRYCRGCWNTCYTVSSRAASYLHLPTIRQYLFNSVR